MVRPFALTAVFVFLAGLILAAPPSRASSSADDGFSSELTPPPSREELETLPKENIVEGDNTGLPLDIRNDAVKEAALSYGARGGLAWRTYHIRHELDRRASYMDKVFDFRNLLIPAPSGLLVEPPVISEDVNAMIINASGEQAAVADRIYNISANARIVSTARSWRNYLERQWGTVEPPPDILRPATQEEREKWIEWVRQGWKEGVRQANDIFEQDLNKLTADYQGMVRYRMLLSQGMVSPPYTLQTDRGVTGGGATLRVGDRAVQITGMPSLIAGAETWQPANR